MLNQKVPLLFSTAFKLVSGKNAPDGLCKQLGIISRLLYVLKQTYLSEIVASALIDNEDSETRRFTCHERSRFLGL